MSTINHVRKSLEDLEKLEEQSHKSWGNLSKTRKAVIEAMDEWEKWEQRLDELQNPSEKYEAAKVDYYVKRLNASREVWRCARRIWEGQAKLTKPYEEYANSHTCYGAHTYKTHPIANDCVLYEKRIEGKIDMLRWPREEMEHRRSLLDNNQTLLDEAVRRCELAERNYETVKRIEQKQIEKARAKAIELLNKCNDLPDIVYTWLETCKTLDDSYELMRLLRFLREGPSEIEAAMIEHKIKAYPVGREEFVIDISDIIEVANNGARGITFMLPGERCDIVNVAKPRLKSIVKALKGDEWGVWASDTGVSFKWATGLIDLCPSIVDTIYTEALCDMRQ